MISKVFLTLGMFTLGTLVYSQETEKDVVLSDGVNNNITATKSGMYDGTNSLKAKNFFNKAYNFSVNQDFQNAEKFYLKAIKEDPNFIEVYDNLGRIYRRSGKYDKAISFYQKSIELYPNGIMAHQNLAVVYGIKKEYNKAIKQFEEIIRISPYNPEGYFGLANSYMMISKFDLAVQNAKKTIEIYTNTNSHYLNEGYYLAGLIYYYAGNNNEAREYFSLAKENGAKIDPNIYKELFSNDSKKKNIHLETKEDYAKYEQDVIDGINWLQITPLDKDPIKRKEINGFLIQWMSGSPNVSIELSEKIVTYMSCSECLMIFMSGWTKYTLQTTDYNKLDANLVGTESVIDFYSSNKKIIGKNMEIEKFIELKEKGKLKSYIKSNI